MGRKCCFYLVLAIAVFPLAAVPLSLANTPAPAPSSATLPAALAIPEVSKAVNEKLAQLDQRVTAAQSSADNAWMLVSAALVLIDDRAGAGAGLRRAGAAEEYAGHHDAELRIDGADSRSYGRWWGTACASAGAGQ